MQTVRKFWLQLDLPAYNQVGKLIIPWALFLAILTWGWRIKDLFHTIPAYGDVLEVLWGISWYGDRLISAESPLFCPLLFYPEGWHVAAFGYGPGMFIALLPLYVLVGGAAFAYNLAAIGSFFVAFAGMYRLTREITGSSFSATVASILFTFWGFRWLRIHGHLNVLLASSLLPWMVWGLERALHTPRKSGFWLAMVGVTWALAITIFLYFTWIGGIVIWGWGLGRWWGNRKIGPSVLIGSFVSTIIAILLSIPALFLFLKGSAAAVAFSYDVHHVNHWGASLNSVPIPFVFHPWLQSLARWIYRGTIDESGVANLGSFACLVALIGLWRIRRNQNWRPVRILICVGLVLALGFTLKWNGEVVQCRLLRPLNSAIWQIGHYFKPEFFTSDQSPYPFYEAVPMPGLVLATFLPFWEKVRTLSRFIFIAGIGFFTLVGYEVGRTRNRAGRVLVAALLVIEIIPPPVSGVPFPTPSHPAFEWLKTQTLPQEGIVDLYAPQPHILALAIRGETLWATQYHERPTVSGASSVWPVHTTVLLGWLLSHPHPFDNPDFVPLLRYYHVDFILLHMQGENERRVFEEVADNRDVKLEQCFDPPAGPSPWSYPICVIRILPPIDRQFNVLFREGWSGREPWGIWAEGVHSHAQWVATGAVDHLITWEAFPHCVPDKYQTIFLEVNGVHIANHQWDSCEPWSGEVVAPASLIQIGWNDIWLHYAYAARPVDVTGGANPDLRMLSVGFTRLEITER